MDTILINCLFFKELYVANLKKRFYQHRYQKIQIDNIIKNNFKPTKHSIGKFVYFFLLFIRPLLTKIPPPKKKKTITKPRQGKQHNKQATKIIIG